MKKLSTIAIVFSTLAITTCAIAQPPGGRGGPPGGGQGRSAEPNPVLEALDADGNEEISAEEIENAVAALKGLDKNGDGKISEADLGRRSRRSGQRDRQRGGPPQGGQQGGRRSGGPPQGGGRPGGGVRSNQGDGGMSPKAAKAFVDQLRQFDENEDGAIAKSELPGRLHTVIDTHDKNKNGSLDKDELDLIGQNSGANETGGRSGPPRDRGPSGPQDGGPGGPPSPADLVTEAMSFDANKDGKLDQDELMKFAEELQHRGPPGSQNGGSQRGGGQGQDRSRGRPRG